MASVKVTMPDGTKYTLGGVDANMSDYDIEKYAREHHQKANADKYAGVPDNQMVLQSEKDSAAYGGDKPGVVKQFGLGALHSLDKQYSGVKSIFTDLDHEHKQRLEQGDAFVKQNGAAASLGELTGDIAPQLALAATTGGAGLLARAGAQGLYGAATTPGTIGDRAIAGGVNALGEGAGALMAGTAKGVTKVAEPFYQGGRDRIINRTLNNAYSGEGDLMSAILRGNKEIVPGIKPTTAQAVMDPGISRLTDSMGSKFSEVGSALKNATTDRTTAYNTLMKNTAGDAESRAYADGIRSKAADADFGAAYAQPLISTPELDAVASNLFKSPHVKAAVPDALDNAASNFYTNPANAGKTFTPSTGGSVSGMDDVVKALQGQTDSAFNSARNTNTAESIAGARDAVVNYLRSASPLYGDAVDNYAKNSRPINQMDLGQKLYETTFPAITDAAGTPFRTLQNNLSNAMRNGDQTVQRATGLKHKSMDEVFEPWQMDRYKAIESDMGRAASAEALGHGSGSATAPRMSDGFGMNSNGLLSNALRGWSYMNGGMVAGQAADGLINRTANKMNGKLASGLGDALVDPNVASSILRNTNMEPGFLMRQIGKNRGLTSGIANGTFNYMPDQFPWTTAPNKQEQ